MVKTIQRLCAQGRLAGVFVDSVKVDESVYRELEAEIGATPRKGVVLIVVMTANGPCEVWRRK